jgi:CRISPR system Cascade subunit CasA
MNLITDPWIPVRDQHCSRRLISPLELLGPEPPTDLAALRPDFNSTLAQFLIGLLQIVAPPNKQALSRIARGEDPLPLSDLRRWAAYFELDRGPCRVMQDLDIASEVEDEIHGLLLEAPGAQTEKNNADLFVKRRPVVRLSLSEAAQALLTLQCHAPSGGQGHRTSLRGGGPVSFLWWPMYGRDDRELPLWLKLWLNVLPLEGEARPEVVLPWLRPCLTSEGGKDVLTQLRQCYGELSGREENLLCYFSTPRRILLSEARQNAVCDISGAVGAVISHYRTRNFGANYLSQHHRHPLSAYYESKGAHFPTHVGAAGFTFADYLQVLGSGYRAPAVLTENSRRVEALLGNRGAGQYIWANGYAMDNMKCEAWHEARFPSFVGVDAERNEQVAGLAQLLVQAAQSVRQSLGRALRRAWTDARKSGDTQTAERALFDRLQVDFYEALQSFIEVREIDAEIKFALKQRWLANLRATAFSVFEEWAEAGSVLEEGLKRLERTAAARDGLSYALAQEVPLALGLINEAKKSKRRAA